MGATFCRSICENYNGFYYSDLYYQQQQLKQKQEENDNNKNRPLLFGSSSYIVNGADEDHGSGGGGGGAGVKSTRNFEKKEEDKEKQENKADAKEDARGRKLLVTKKGEILKKQNYIPDLKTCIEVNFHNNDEGGTNYMMSWVLPNMPFERCVTVPKKNFSIEKLLSLVDWPVSQEQTVISVKGGFRTSKENKNKKNEVCIMTDEELTFQLEVRKVNLIGIQLYRIVSKTLPPSGNTVTTNTTKINQKKTKEKPKQKKSPTTTTTTNTSTRCTTTKKKKCCSYPQPHPVSAFPFPSAPALAYPQQFLGLGGGISSDFPSIFTMAALPFSSPLPPPYNTTNTTF